MTEWITPEVEVFTNQWLCWDKNSGT